MTYQLRDLLNKVTAQSLANDLKLAYPKLSVDPFVNECLDNEEQLSLTERASQWADVMYRHLPTSFPKAAPIILQSLGDELANSDTFGMSPLRYMPHVNYVSKYGLEHFDEAMTLQIALTKRFSAEFSIRAFLLRYPEKTLAQLHTWTKDPNVHVRRLVSEGTRPRLPWAPRLRDFQEDPLPVLALLEKLKDDPERYVQRSVANNLNDISKDHPSITVEVCRRWLKKPTENRVWIVKHALRTLIKKGDQATLELLGVGTKPQIDIRAISLQPKRVKLNNKFQFSFEMVNQIEDEQELLVDFTVHFVKANGETKPKVFKLKKVVLSGKKSVVLQSRVSFAPMTTRKHYPGTHHLDALINGQRYSLGSFEVEE
jgi:3-methyladenine DNA glycosylase AlkC